MEVESRGAKIRCSLPYAVFAKRSQLVSATNGAESFGGGFVRLRECYSRNDLLIPQILTEPDHLVVVPTASTLDSHFETLFACGQATSRVLVLGSVVSRLKALGYGRTLQKLRDTIRLDANRKWMGFADENFERIKAPKTTKNTLHWLADFQRQSGSLNLVILSENEDFRRQVEQDIPSLQIMPASVFVRELCHPAVGLCTEEEYRKAMVAAESGDLALAADNSEESDSSNMFSASKPLGDASALSLGPRLRGRLKCIGPRTAFVSGTNAIILGAEFRNRSIHGDMVEIEPIVKQHEQSGLVSTEDEIDSSVLMTKHAPYRVVSVIKSAEKRRSLVVTLDARKAERLTSSSLSETQKLLCIPMDDRYPKLRVYTRLGSALVGKRFIVEIVDWPEGSMWPNARYLRTLGTALDLKTESSAILVETELGAHEKPFPPAALEELPSETELKIDPVLKEGSGVVDFRDRRVVSIDPIGCQDIDDAISLERQPDGSFELAVHIADVARFVKSGGALDREASSRATSVYLQERRLDMLPALLCENLCSLRPQVDRYAVSAIFKVDVQTLVVDVHSARFQRTVIRSRHALAYVQAQRLADGSEPGEVQRGGWTGGEVDREDWTWLRETIRTLMGIARLRGRQRKSLGAVSLDSVEVSFALDAAGRPVDVSEDQYLEVFDTVAELMILANEAAARLMLKKVPTRALVRHHPPADPLRFQPCIELAKNLGLQFDASSNKAVAASLQAIGQAVNKDTFRLIQSLATRALSEAQYVCTGAVTSQHVTESPFYHFGLGLDHYTHFTSPIRRYADLVVARLLLEDDFGCDESLKMPSDAPVTSVSEVKLKSIDEDDKMMENKRSVEAHFMPPSNEEDDFSWADALGKGSDDEEEEMVPAQRRKKEDPQAQAEDDDLLIWVTEQTRPSLNNAPIVGIEREAHQKSMSSSEKTTLNSILDYGTSSASAPVDSVSSVAPSGTRTTEKHSHTTTQAVQEICEHINIRHRAAKEASSRSQELFFSLYFADRGSTEVRAIVSSIKSDGIHCVVPDFDLRIPIRLISSSGQVCQDAFSLPVSSGLALSDLRVVRTKEVIQITTPQQGSTLKSLRVTDQVRLMVSCDLYPPSGVPPGPRVPAIRGTLIVSTSSDSSLQQENILGQANEYGKDALRKAVIISSIEKLSRGEDEENARVRISTRKSLYTSRGTIAQNLAPRRSEERRPLLSMPTVGRRSFGGYVPQPRQLPGIRHYLNDEADEEEGETGGYKPRVSASSMTASQMKKLEIEATNRIAKLQAQKFDSRVKRRMKKGAN